MERRYPKNLNIFMGNLPPALQKKQISEILASIGEYEKIQVPIQETNRKLNRGYMFLRCLDKKSFDALIQADLVIEGQRLVKREYLDKVDISCFFRLNNKRTMIYVINIVPKISNVDLKNAFSKFGVVESAYAIKGSKIDKRLFYGYVQFSEEKSIEKIPKDGVEISGVMISWKKFFRDKPNLKKKEPKPAAFSENAGVGLTRSQRVIHDINPTIRNWSTIIEFYSELELKSEKIEANHNPLNVEHNRDFSYCLSQKLCRLLDKIKE